MATTIERVDSVEAFTAALHGFAPDVVLSDQSLPRIDSREALELVRAVRPTAPFIIVTRTLSGTQCIAAIRAGAENLILKEYLSLLVSSITDALAVRGPLYKLTDRQIEVLKLVAEGLRTRVREATRAQRENGRKPSRRNHEAARSTGCRKRSAICRSRRADSDALIAGLTASARAGFRARGAARRRNRA